MNARACCGVVQIRVIGFNYGFTPSLSGCRICSFLPTLPALRHVLDNSVLELAPLFTPDSRNMQSRFNCTQIVHATSIDNEVPSPC